MSECDGEIEERVRQIVRAICENEKITVNSDSSAVAINRSSATNSPGLSPTDLADVHRLRADLYKNALEDCEKKLKKSKADLKKKENFIASKDELIAQQNITITRLKEELAAKKG